MGIRRRICPDSLSVQQIRSDFDNSGSVFRCADGPVDHPLIGNDAKQDSLARMNFTVDLRGVEIRRANQIGAQRSEERRVGKECAA